MSEKSDSADDLEILQQYFDHFEIDYDNSIPYPKTLHEIRNLIKTKPFNVNSGCIGYIYDMKMEYYNFLTPQEIEIIDCVNFETNIGSSDIICKEAFYKLKTLYNI